jgi:hypothetical protein
MDKAAEMQISVGFRSRFVYFDKYFSAFSTSWQSNLKCNDEQRYVLGAFCTSHWATVITCMKFKEVWYLDSAKQHPPLMFLDLQPVLN